jgi:predicted nucleic acid-binding protein
MRAVLDTDVLGSALRSDLGASRVLLLAALDQKFELLLSGPLVIEYEAVITRPAHLKAAGLKKPEPAAILDALVYVQPPSLRSAARQFELQISRPGEALDRLRR